MNVALGESRTVTSLDAAEVRKFAAIADQWWSPKGKFAPLHRMNPVRLEFIRDEIVRHFRGGGTPARRPLTGLSLLDIGCGGGLVSEPMARLGATVTGLDAAEETIAVARTHAEGMALNIDYRVGLVEELPAEPGYDVVLALEIVEHVADLSAFLRAAARQVKPGGLIIISTINRTPEAFAFAIVGAERLLRWLPAGAHQFDKLVSPDELRQALQGLNELDVRGPYGMAYKPLSGKWSLSLDARINYLMVAARRPHSKWE